MLCKANRKTNFLPRSIPKHREPIGDASEKGVSAAVYAVVVQESGASISLVTAKARPAKRGLSIHRLERISAHMAVNLTMNVGEELQGFPLRKLHCWLDSSVALHWIRGATMVKPKSINIKQFVLQPDAKD